MCSSDLTNLRLATKGIKTIVCILRPKPEEHQRRAPEPGQTPHPGRRSDLGKTEAAQGRRLPSRLCRRILSGQLPGPPDRAEVGGRPRNGARGGQQTDEAFERVLRRPKTLGRRTSIKTGETVTMRLDWNNRFKNTH